MKLCLALLTLLLAGCASNPPQQLMPVQPKLILVLVGGNSEAAHRSGVWDLYGGRQKAKNDMVAVRELSGLLGIAPDDVSVHYFSWTGDPEGDSGLLPGHWGWVTGGSRLIREQLPALALPPAQRPPVAVVGWSNGGATAYELSCDLAALNRSAVSLLVTLDPVAWTTRPCVGNDRAPLRVADGWVNVYTRSSSADRLKFGNIIALFGRAWDDHFPEVKADDLQRLPGANHGDTLPMWQTKVMPSPVMRQWAARVRPQ